MLEIAFRPLLKAKLVKFEVDMDALWIPYFIDALIFAIASMILYGALRKRIFMSGEWHYLNDKSTHFWSVMFGNVRLCDGIIRNYLFEVLLCPCCVAEAILCI